MQPGYLDSKGNYVSFFRFLWNRPIGISGLKLYVIFVFFNTLLYRIFHGRMFSSHDFLN